MDLVLVSASFQVEGPQGSLSADINIIQWNNVHFHELAWKYKIPKCFPSTKDVERAAELPRHCRSTLESWGEICGNCCLGNKWELRILIFMWFDQTSVDVLRWGQLFSPLRDSFPSRSCTGSLINLCLDAWSVSYLTSRDFGRGRTMFSTWKGWCGAENRSSIFLQEQDLSAWDLWAVWIRSLSSRVWVISLEGYLIYGACPKSPWEENLLKVFW